ncbi:MAG TPA: pitrilysin family protein [Planctomycetota bacterium]|nr:pitrilysin family protein [Planctomycetota bacterium]
MKLVPLENTLGEPLLAGTAGSGLRLLINPRPGWARSFAALGVNFGSIDRDSGQPVPEGLAHFLEHKLFEDRDGDVTDRFAALGASANAMTGFTATTYVVSTVEAPLECLDLLLDFVQDPWFTDALVAKEQGIIAQEIRMYDDDPEWRLFFGLMGCLYERHPVRDNIAGTVESIAAIDAAVLRRFYERFYRPRNLCLAVSSPLDPGEIAARVEADQSGRPADPLPAHARRPVDEPDGRRLPRAELRLPVARPRLLLGLKDRPTGRDGVELLRRELTTRILLDALFGPASPAYERLYERGLVDDTFSASYSAEASFGFATVGGDTDDPAALEAALREVLTRALAEGVDPAAFRRVRNKLQGALLRALDSPESVALTLVGEALRGAPAFTELSLFDTLAPGDLDRRAAELVRDEALAVSVVLPREA